MMWNDILSGWITEESIAKGQAKEIASNDRMIILELSGKGVFKRNIQENQNAISLLMTGGNLSFIKEGMYNMVLAPAFVDFILARYWDNIETSDDFRGYLVVVDQVFFQQVIEEIRFHLSDTIYKYVQNPFVQLELTEVERMERLIFFLSDTIERQEHVFRGEIMRTILQTLQFDLWNIIVRVYPSKTTEETPLWNNLAGDFLHLVRTFCREHHEVRWYAERLCVSPDLLSAKLRKLYGKSASRLIDETLAADAKTCLLNEKYSIQDVADLLGFSDQAAFGKFFKRCSGISPSAFRKGKTF